MRQELQLNPVLFEANEEVLLHLMGALREKNVARKSETLGRLARSPKPAPWLMCPALER